MKTYDFDYFIDFFSKIPAENWIIERYKESKTKKCAVGHCSRFNGFVQLETPRSLTLERLTNWCIYSINDGDTAYLKYGKKPKTRVINYLKHLKKKNNGRKIEI